MNKVLLVFTVLLIFTGKLFSQITPIKGAKLHYRIIGFSFPSVENAQKYTLQVAYDQQSGDGADFSNAIVTEVSKTNKIIAEVPFFGRNYIWRVVATTSKGQKISPQYRFSTLSSSLIDPNYTRLKVTTDALSYKDAYVFLDCTNALYDMKGNPVWFLPDTLCPDRTFGAVVDLKPSVAGTISYLYSSGLFDIDYNGNILTHLPSALTSAPLKFHHDQMRLVNGNYMVLGQEDRWVTRVGKKDSIARAPVDSERIFLRIPFGTIEEYSQKGKLLWRWNSADYFENSDLVNLHTSDGEIDPDMHMNSFYFDERNSAVYVGFRNISRILKIKYPEGSVIGVYGEKCDRNAISNTYYYCYQHSCRFTDDGLLYVFNNNTCKSGDFPKIEKLKETENGTLVQVWEYDFPVKPRPLQLLPKRLPGDISPKPIYNPRSPAGRTGKTFIGRGGNMVDLINGDVFASLNSPYGELVILNDAKNVQWKAKIEKYDSVSGKWDDLPTYRASILANQKDLENLIWNCYPIK